jgi:hypothetical protein
MATIRTLIGVILLFCAAVIAWLGFAYNHYQEDCCDRGGSTLRWTIPWAVATAVLAILVLGAIFNTERRARWSWLALGLGLVMALAVGALFAFGPSS